jgi:hypothetical protein
MDPPKGPAFVNDGSFMAQFMRKYEGPTDEELAALAEEKALEQEKQLRKEMEREREEDRAREREEKQRDLERRRREYEEAMQRQREEMEVERQKREEMTSALLAEQKRQQDEALERVQSSVPKARKQPFVSKTAPSTSLKRAAPRDRPAMPVVKRQRVAPPPSQQRSSATEPPKPPLGTLRRLVDELAVKVVEQGPAQEQEVEGHPHYSSVGVYSPHKTLTS